MMSVMMSCVLRMVSVPRSWHALLGLMAATGLYSALWGNLDDTAGRLAGMHRGALNRRQVDALLGGRDTLPETFWMFMCVLHVLYVLMVQVPDYLVCTTTFDTCGR